MINPKELRIGNLVKCEGKIRSVDQIGIGLISLIPIEGITFDVCQGSELDPIPLTHEILEKAGFVYNKETEYYIRRYSLGADLEINLFCLFINEFTKDFQVEYYSMPIKSVHQLQNLFHALTGEELEIKL